jgi:hypothetical protein
MSEDEKRLEKLQYLKWSDRLKSVGDFLVLRFKKRVAAYRSIVKPLEWETDDGIGFMAKNPWCWCSVIGDCRGAIAFHCGVVLGKYSTVDEAKAALEIVWVDQILTAIDERKIHDLPTL